MVNSKDGHGNMAVFFWRFLMTIKNRKHKNLIDFSKLSPEQQKEYWAHHQEKQEKAENEKVAQRAKKILDQFRSMNIQ
jgi:hypothetical protein